MGKKCREQKIMNSNNKIVMTTVVTTVGRYYTSSTNTWTMLYDSCTIVENAER